jgi:hypothetical protein
MVEPLREAVLRIRSCLNSTSHGPLIFENALLQNIKRAILEAISDWTLG